MSLRLIVVVVACCSFALMGCGEEEGGRGTGGGGGPVPANHNQCEPIPAEEACEEAELECGTHELPDGCEGTMEVSCGNELEVCGEFETCGGGGEPGICGCTTLSDEELCEEEEVECGPLQVVDACGESRNIDTCGLPSEVCGEFETCGGGGEEGVCGCTPTSCEEEGILCGTISDGCGAQLECDLFCAEQVEVGDQHGCAVGSGRVKCWGRNHYGQLGVGDTSGRQNPDDVDGIETAVAVSAGSFHSCVLLDDGSVRCWGRNDRGQLGVGSTVPSSVPSSQAIFSGALAVESGELHSCAIVGEEEEFNGADGPETLPAGRVECWGSNDYGQIGDPVLDLGTTVGVPTEVALPAGMVAVEIAAGANHSCALVGTVGGEPREAVYCWGRNDFGQIQSRQANYSSAFDLANTSSSTIEPDDPNGVVRSFNVSSCGTLSGLEVSVNISHRDRGLLEVVLIAPDDTEVVLHEGDGEGEDLVATYSTEIQGYLGSDGAGQWAVRVVDTDGAFDDEEEEEGEVNSVTLSFFCEEAILAEIQANGGLFYAIKEPTALALGDHMDRPRWISAGMQHTCVLDDDTEEAVCWGAFYASPRTPTSCNSTINLYQGSGEPANNSTAFNPDFCSILPRHDSPGAFFRAMEYSVQTNGNHNLQRAAIDGLSSEPVRIEVGDQMSPVAMVSGANHFCGIVDVDEFDRSNIYCLGSNRFGQVGDGTDNNWYFTRVVNRDVDDNTVEAVQMSLGLDFSCALLVNNNIQCWGNNEHGQIGNSSLQEDESFRPFDVRLQLAD